MPPSPMSSLRIVAPIAVIRTPPCTRRLLRRSLPRTSRPVAAKNASSSVSHAVAPLHVRDRLEEQELARGRAGRRGRRALSASTMSCVQSRIVASCVCRTSLTKSCTSSFERGSRPGRRLVEQEQDRRGEQRARERDLLLHPARQVLHRLAAPVGAGSRPSRGSRDRRCASTTRRHAVEARRVREVLGRGHLLEEARLDGDAVHEPPDRARVSRKASWPKMRASPPSSISSVESRRTSVDLPEPFWPRMATHSPRAIVKRDVLERGHATCA